MLNVKMTVKATTGRCIVHKFSMNLYKHEISANKCKILVLGQGDSL